MANNIVEMIQKNLGYAALQKVDPNTQEIKDKYAHSSTDKLGQAAIPAVLTAVYHFTRTEEGCNGLLSDAGKADWLSAIYGGNEKEAVEKVAHYAGVTTNQAESHMENIADEAVRLIREQPGVNSAEKVKVYVSSQRHEILVYLPAALNMGNTLNDEMLDDKTNKMEGPISNFMHKIENAFSDGDSKKGDF